MIELLMLVLFILMVIMAYFLCKQDEEIEKLRISINNINNIIIDCLSDKENKE